MKLNYNKLVIHAPCQPVKSFKKCYKRMYETRAHRPYYTIANLGGMGIPLKEVSGFGYHNTIYIISRDMNNTAYFDIEEMKRATEHFRILWKDEKKVAEIIKVMKSRFKEATRAEKEAWKQNWSEKTDNVLLKEMRRYFNLCLSCLGTMYVSNPQHVSPLEEKINSLLENNAHKDAILNMAMSYKGVLPWTSAPRSIIKSQPRQDKLVNKLVNKYGWFNEIEGDKPFNAGHYREKIINFRKEIKIPEINVAIPDDVFKIGRLIGELGFLRLWNRYHFMHLRYHTKKIFQELTRRSGVAALEFATVDEVEKFFSNSPVNLAEIKKRKNGYAAYFDKEHNPVIVTGSKAEKFKEKVQGIAESDTVKGNVARKGYASGKVRIISFSAKNYDEQVAAFTEGEILVTGMTRPQIIHLCRKAAAIITDEGGITCHAAVVSREFNVPCIIATHNATKVLKTGDKVEVDADKGVVRKLQNWC